MSRWTPTKNNGRSSRLHASIYEGSASSSIPADPSGPEKTGPMVDPESRVQRRGGSLGGREMHIGKIHP